jgi:hypothetical protein
MLNIIFKIMIILPLFQTWLIWNGYSVAEYFEHGLYFIFSFFVVLYFLLKKPKMHKNIAMLLILFLIFINIGFITTLVQNMINGYASMKGLMYETYKLSRNVSIFLFAYLFQTKREVIKNIKLYFFVTAILAIVAIFEHFYGLQAYEFLRFTPDPSTYRDFYLVYLRDNRAMGLLKHPNIFAIFVMFALIILIFSTSMNVQLLKKKYLQYLLLLLSLVGVLISASRSVFLLSMLIPLLLSFVYKIKRVRLIYIILLILSSPFLVFAINQLIFKLWQYRYYTFEEGQTEMRLVYWMDAFNILLDNKLFGAGIGTWGDASASFSSFRPNGQIVSMSDSYLSHLLAEHGVNLVFVAMIFIFTLFSFSKNFRLSEDNFTKFMNMIGISMLIFVFFESFKSMQLSMYENTFFMFYLFGYIFKINNETNCTRANLLYSSRFANVNLQINKKGDMKPDSWLYKFNLNSQHMNRT